MFADVLMSLSTLEDTMAETTHWEYQFMEASPENDAPAFDQRLNALGAIGWELVAVIPRRETTFVVFKRPRADDGSV
jgi:hypothetical protein